MGLLPLAVIAQTNKPQTTAPTAPPAKPPGAVAVPPKPASTEMPSKDKVSYAIGMNIGNGLKHQEIDVDVDTLATAIKDILAGKPARLSDKESGEVLTQLRVAMQAKKEAQETTFLAQFAKSAGVTTLSNGLEYKVIKEGDGAMPKENDTVTVAYRGTLSNGTEFDHNDDFKTPIRGRIIQGWQKILPLMKVGSKWQVAIPSSLGYGPRGFPPKIPGNSVLLFDLELKSITPGAPTLPPISAAPPATSKPAAPAPAAPPAASQATPVVSGEIIKVPSADELKKGAKIEVIKAGQTNVVNPQ